MKLVVALLAVCALGVQSKPVQQRDLSTDYDDFLALIPMGDVFDIFINSLNDKEIQKIIFYMFSPRFSQIIEEIDTIQEFRDFVDFSEEAGIGLRTFMDNLKEILNIAPQQKGVIILTKYLKSSLLARISGEARDIGGTNGLVHALKETVPWDEFWGLYADKMETSPEFRQMIETMDSDERKQLTEALIQNERFNELSAELTAAGVDAAGLIRITRVWLGLIAGPK